MVRLFNSHIKDNSNTHSRKDTIMWLNHSSLGSMNTVRISGSILALVSFLLLLEWLTMTVSAEAASCPSFATSSVSSSLAPLWLCWVWGLVNGTNSPTLQSVSPLRSSVVFSLENSWSKVLCVLSSFLNSLKRTWQKLTTNDNILPEDDMRKPTLRRMADKRNARTVRLLVFVNLLAMFGFGGGYAYLAFQYKDFKEMKDDHVTQMELHQHQFTEIKKDLIAQFDAQELRVKGIQKSADMMFARVDSVAGSVTAMYKESSKGERFTAGNAWQMAQLLVHGRVDMDLFPKDRLIYPVNTWFTDWLKEQDLIDNCVQ